MLLETIESAGSASRKRFGAQSSLRETNRTSDIPGASVGTTAEFKLSQYTNKPDFKFSTADIPHSRPARLLAAEPFNKPNYSLMTNDVAGSYGPTTAGLVTKRCVDPLNPRYELPQVVERPITPPSRPSKDVLAVDDIEGTRSRSIYRFRDRENNMNVFDIEGTSPGWKPSFKRRETLSMALEARDINGQGIFRTSRSTDPQSPRYDYDGFSEIGKLQQNHCPVLHRARASGPTDNSLRTVDIPFSSPLGGHKLPLHFPRGEQRRHHRPINRVDDIAGTAPKVGMSTFHVQSKRRTDPNNPAYPTLETKEELQLLQTVGTMRQRSASVSAFAAGSAAHRRRGSSSRGDATGTLASSVVYGQQQHDDEIAAVRALK